MPDATVENVPADRGEARRRLTQARKHLDSARAAVDNESSYILLYSAVHKALSGALLAVGRRVGAGERAHLILISEAKNLLGQEHARLFTRVDRARRKRNNVAYDTTEVTAAELESMQTDTAATLDIVEVFIETHGGEAGADAPEEQA